MTLSLPWAIGSLGKHTTIEQSNRFETTGFNALLISIAISVSVGLAFYLYGRKSTGRLFLKEAMAVVGLSWMMATVLGAFPYLLSGTYRGPALRVLGATAKPQICGSDWRIRGQWIEQELLSADEYRAVESLLNAGFDGLSETDLHETAGVNSTSYIRKLDESNRWWSRCHSVAW